MYCRNCGKEIPDDSKFCQECGHAVDGCGDTCEAPKPQVVYTMKSDLLALVLSFLIIGAGHIYAGKAERGIKLLVLSVLIWVLAAVASMIYPPLMWAGAITIITWIYGMADSYEAIQEYNNALKSNGYPPW